MISSKKLAELTCPACQTLQPIGRLLRTIDAENPWIKSVECCECQASLRIRPSDALLFRLIVSSAALVLIWISGVAQYVGGMSFSDFKLAAFLEVALRISVCIYILFWIVIPLSSRILTVEHIK